MMDKLTLIHKGEWIVSNEVAITKRFLVVVGVLTNRFESDHIWAHRYVSASNINIKYVSCAPLGYKKQVILSCKRGGRSQLEHTRLWLGVAPTLFPRATYICKMDIDTLIFPQTLSAILRSLFPPAVYGHSCWVDPCLWGARPVSTAMRCMTQNAWRSCDAISRVSCGVCGGFYALTYDVASKISHMTNDTTLSAKFGDLEDRYTSDLIQRSYGSNFLFASDWKYWQTYPNYNITTAAVIHNIKTKRQWKSVLKSINSIS